MEKKIQVIDIQSGEIFDLVEINPRSGLKNENGFKYVIIHNEERGFLYKTIDKLRFINTNLEESENVIRLTGAEIQSRQNRVKWAETLITQLPVEHEGRNSWLLNYGTQNEAKARREEKGIKFNEEYQAAEISPKETQKSGEYKNSGPQEKKGNVKLCDFNEIPYGFDSWKQVWKLIKEEELKRDADIIEFRVAVLDRSFFVTKKQIIDYTLQEMEKEEQKEKETKFKSPFIAASEIFKEYIENYLNCRCNPNFPKGGEFSKTENLINKEKTAWDNYIKEYYKRYEFYKTENEKGEPCIKIRLKEGEKDFILGPGEINIDSKGVLNFRKGKSIGELTAFEFESIILTALEKFYSSKFHK